MDHGSGSTRPFWRPRGLRAPALRRDVSCEVCVVGGGWAGLTLAYSLARERRSVVVLEARELYGGESARTTAHLSSVPDVGLRELEATHGRAAVKLAVSAHAAAVDAMERLVKRERIVCGFRRLDGWRLVERGQNADLAREYAAARRAGLEVSREDAAPASGWRCEGALRYPGQATLDPLDYLHGLARAAARRGARLYASSPAVEFSGGQSALVRTAAGPAVSCRAVVVATNAPVIDRVAVAARQAAYRSYAVALALGRARAPDALYWDAADPYHYVRLAGPRGARALVVGGEDHRVGQAFDFEERFARLESWTRQRFPGCGRALARWSGQVQEPADGLAYIGRHPAWPENVFIVTGDCGQGTTHGTLAALILKELIAGRKSPWAALYDPARVTPAAAPRYALENVENAFGYLGYATPGEVSSPREIARGEGALMRRGLSKAAVFRDARGRVVERSAVCPHLGGVVRWNACEKSWDCPVHGSRFSPDGRPLCGPANSPLA